MSNGIQNRSILTGKSSDHSFHQGLVVLWRCHGFSFTSHFYGFLRTAGRANGTAKTSFHIKLRQVIISHNRCFCRAAMPAHSVRAPSTCWMATPLETHREKHGFQNLVNRAGEPKEIAGMRVSPLSCVAIFIFTLQCNSMVCSQKF